MTPAGSPADCQDLIAAAIHRMSQPLTVLRGTLEMALAGVPAALGRESLELAGRECERLALLAEALRELAPPLFLPPAAPPLLFAAASAALEEIAPLAARRALQLDVAPALAALPAAALAAAARPLAEAFLRLAGAALDRARSRLVWRAAAAAVELEDDGLPLADADWRRLFDPFAANADIRRSLAHALARRAFGAAGVTLGFAPTLGGAGNLLRLACS